MTADTHIVPRDLSFGVSANPQRHWFEGDALKTAIFDCFSIFLPAGERYFIRSLNHYSPKLTDSDLRDEVRGFSAQEAYHTREHVDYNASLKALGYDVDRMEESVAVLLGDDKPPWTGVAVTCAIEHITTTFATAVWRRPELFDKSVGPHSRLWMWHALEELEHKAVAMNVFNVIAKDVSAWKRYLFRTGAMTIVVFHLASQHYKSTKMYVRHDGGRPGATFPFRYLWSIYIGLGFAKTALGTFLKFYVPGFDPAKLHDADLLDRAQRWLDREIAAGRIAAGKPAAARASA